MDKRTIAPLFRQRLQQLLSQSASNPSQFARRSGLDRSALSQFLAADNVRLPRAEALCRIASEYGVSIDWLLGVSGASDSSQQISSSAEIELVADDATRSPLDQWRAEISGGKTRYIPAYLPDMLSLPALIGHELEPHRASSRYSFGEELLSDVQQRGNDLEICMPVQTLQALSRGDGIWQQVPLKLRREQFHYMARLVEQHYPALRVHLFDALHHYSAPLTVFGNQRAVLYLGGSYLVVSGAEQVRGLSQHFDQLVREACVLPHEVHKVLLEMGPS